MPWGTIILGIFLTTGVHFALPQFITGTSSAETLVKTAVPLFLAFFFAIAVIFGMLQKN